MVTKIRKGARVYLYITEHMKKQDISDEHLANRIGVARETVFRWRKEQRRLNPEKIAVIASALDMEPHELYRPPDNPFLDTIVRKAPAEDQAFVEQAIKRIKQAS